MISIKTGASQNYIDGFHRVFSDDFDFIHSVLSCANEVFEIYDENRFIGGLCTIDLSIKTAYNSIKTGAYIYGAFICESERGKGYFKKLCDHVCEFYSEQFYDFVMTVPGNASLFSLYRRLGFDSTLYGTVSLTGDKTEIILPEDTAFYDFDGSFDSLYFTHIKNDGIIKTYDLFKHTLDGFEIKHIELNGKKGYALLSDGKLIFASAPFASYKTAEKGLLKKLTDFELPNVLCDILFEI